MGSALSPSGCGHLLQLIQSVTAKRYCLIPWPEEVEWSNTGSDYGLLLSLLLSCILGDWLLEVCSFHGRGKTGKEN